MHWLPYQRRFLRAARDPRYRVVALSMPRGGGKSTLAGYLVAQALTPGTALYRRGGESVLFSGSIEQCRIVYRIAMQCLEDAGVLDDYRLVDSATRVAITRRECRTRLKAIGSNPKTSLGLVQVPLAIIDEPGALATVGGNALWDSVRTAQGKVGSSMKIVICGTLAPADAEGWWPRLVERGSHGATWVECIQGRPDRWSQWREIARVNPLAKTDAGFAAVLREERDDALADSRLKSAFLSYRLNLPTEDESSVLLTPEEWRRVLDRPVPARSGRPIVGIDLGAGRAWSAAVALWRNGRVECLALTPGVPSLADQEKRDRVPAGVYQRLSDAGSLHTEPERRVQTVASLWKAVRASWGRPAVVLVDRFRFLELRDAMGGECPLTSRARMWSQSSEDIRAARRLALDGPLSVAPGARSLLAASLARARVVADASGNLAMLKHGTNNLARDDVAQALILAAGALVRAPAPSRLRTAIAA